MDVVQRGTILPAQGQPGQLFVKTDGGAGAKIYTWANGAWEAQYFLAADAVAAVAASPKVALVAAPASGSIAASELYLWFDDTNGAGALMMKGKTANGTVVTGTVALT